MDKKRRKVELEKQKVAKKAVKYLNDCSVVGVGSGTTVGYFIKFLGKKLANNDLKNIKAVPTSLNVKYLLKSNKIPLIEDNEAKIDIAIDGLDSLLKETSIVVKGKGGAFLQEKIVDYIAKKLILIGDNRKLNRNVPVPIEVLPSALESVKYKVKKLGGKPKLRKAKKKVGPVISDNGNIICDIRFTKDQLAPKLERKLNVIPGILESGIFTKEAKVLIGYEGGNKVQTISI